MSNGLRRSDKTLKLTYLALMTAMVVVLQLFIPIKFGMFSCTLVLVPMVIGAAICGAYGGAWLGLVFGVVVLLSGDAAAFLTVDPFGTIVTVLLKGACAGLVSGLVYSALKKLNVYVATVCAAIVAPIVNTGIFIIGSFLFFYDTVSEWGAAMGFANGAAYIFFGLAGGNFILEFVLNLAISPVLVRLLDLLNKKAFKA